MRIRITTWLRTNAIALSALFVALGGVSYAAVKIPANSVGSKQIRAAGVATSDLRSGAVTSAKVRDGALLARDFKAGQLPAGARGATGEPGAPGAPGTPGATGPSDGYVATKTAKTKIPNNYTTEVVGLDLPAGSYLARATTTFVSTSSEERLVRCGFASPAFAGIASGNGAVVGAAGATPDGEVITSLSTQVAFTLTEPGRLRLNCGHDGAPLASPNDPAVETTTLTAIRVGTLHVQ